MRVRVTVTVGLLLTALTPVLHAQALAPATKPPGIVKICGTDSEESGPCAQSTGTGVTLQESRTHSGTSKTSRPSRSRGTSATTKSPEERTLPPCVLKYAVDTVVWTGTVLPTADGQWNRNPIPGAPTMDCENPDQASSSATPTITATEFAHLAPAAAPVTGEPFNIGVAGLPTNFVVPANTHTTTGDLFGTPVTVRFTPSRFDFDYGDEESQSTTTGGYTWESRGEPQFTPTPTSHVYAERGVYTVSVTVTYTAELETAAGWTPIPGEVTTPAATQGIRIYEAHTALVRYTCDEDPDGIGC